MTAPYAVGDHVQALSAGPAGTSLITGRVVGIHENDDTAHPWTITYTDPYDVAGIRTVRVDRFGRDRNRYVERTHGVLPWLIAESEPARLLREVATKARAARVIGGLLRAAGNHGVSAAWSWPSGGDHYVVDVDCTVTPPIYEVSAYYDGKTEPYHQAPALVSIDEAVAELVWLDRPDPRNYDAACQHSADAQGITAIVAALNARGVAAEVWQTGGFCMVAAVRLAADRFIGMNDDGGLLVIEYTQAQWDGEDETPDEHVHRFDGLAGAAAWVAQRVAEHRDANPHPDEFIHADERPAEPATIGADQ